MREIRIPHDEINNPQTITQRNARAFREAGLDIHKNEVMELHDDFKRKIRVLKVKDRLHFDMGKMRTGR